ncbi:MAG: hypothetical protein HY259_09290 [Chloroflexi bacterium]|nr:hypothetical protein [Chloroflexota bacterium]
MRMMTLFCLLIITACTAPAQPAEPSSVPTTLPTSTTPPSGETTDTPIAAQLTATPVPTATPTATPYIAAVPPPGDAVLLSVLDQQEQRREIRLVDPATGQKIPGYPPIKAAHAAFSPDGQKLAAIEYGGQSCVTAGGSLCVPVVLHLVDIQTWHEVTAALPALPPSGWAEPIAFSPDNARLALVYQETDAGALMLFDTSQARLIAQRPLDFRVAQMAFAADGKMLSLYGQPDGPHFGEVKPPPPRILLVDGATLDLKWNQTLADIVSGSWCLETCDQSHELRLSVSWRPAALFSRDGGRLTIVHADSERLTTVDLSARTVRTVEIRAARSWFEQLLDLTAGVAEAKGGFVGAYKTAVILPDGKTLYLLGQMMNAARDSQGRWDTTYATTGLHVIDTQSGRQTATRESSSKWIKLTADGATLLLTGNDVQNNWWSEVYDTRTLQRVARLDQWEVTPSRRLDGQPILLASQPLRRQPQLAVLDPRTFAVLHIWSADTFDFWPSAIVWE